MKWRDFVRSASRLVLMAGGGAEHPGRAVAYGAGVGERVGAAGDEGGDV